MSKFWFLPEWQNSAPFFYGRIGKLISESVEIISGYRLWAFSSALNNCLAPMVVVAARDPEHQAAFYKVLFEGECPDLSNLGLRLNADDSVVFMDEDHLMNHQDLIPVTSNNWKSCIVRYECLGAMRYLGLISEISAPLVQDPSAFTSLDATLMKSYNLNSSITNGLEQLYVDALFGLSFFGFTNTSDPNRYAAVKYGECLGRRSVAADCNCYFAFGAIEWAIRSYHKKGFGRDQLFTPSTFGGLKDSFMLVAELLRHLKYVVQDDNLHISLRRALQLYQSRSELGEEYCGEKTLRSLLFECDRNWLLKAAGFRHTPNNLSILETSLCEIREVNRLLEELPLLANEEQVLGLNIAQNIGNYEHLWHIVNEKVSGCERRLRQLDSAIKELTQTSGLVNSRLEQTEESLETMLSDQRKREETVVRVKWQIFGEERQNRGVFWLGCVAILLVMILFVFRPIRKVFG
jgi:hypothetical protein